jgi:hypothetical protein
MTTREILENIEEAIVIAKDCTYHAANQILRTIAELWDGASQSQRYDLLNDEGCRAALCRINGIAYYDAELDEALKNYLAIL